MLIVSDKVANQHGNIFSAGQHVKKLDTNAKNLFIIFAHDN